MKPFNIKIPVAGQEITLTILPFGKEQYRIIYYGGILGAIRFRKNWTLLPQEEAIGEDLPPYLPNPDDERVEVHLNPEIIGKIGDAIVNSKSF